MYSAHDDKPYLVALLAEQRGGGGCIVPGRNPGARQPAEILAAL